MFLCELMPSVSDPELGLVRFACENVSSGSSMISPQGGTNLKIGVGGGVVFWLESTLYCCKHF